MQEVRVGKLSEPSKVASSILFILNEGEDVEVSALGMSCAILIKACALVNNINAQRMKLVYVPYMEYITDDFGETRTAVKMTINHYK